MEPRRTAYHSLGRWLTRSRPGVYFFRYVWTPVDRGVARLTRGRRNLAPRAMTQMLLTTTGRKSGEPRSTPVLYLREGDSYVVIGSNYGRSHHPAWTYNLSANPSATVHVAGRVTEVTARRATPEEVERFWPRFVDLWPGWPVYRRMTDREFRMFVLEPGAAPSGRAP